MQFGNVVVRLQSYSRTLPRVFSCWAGWAFAMHCSTLPCSAGAVWIDLLLCSCTQTFGHCKRPERRPFCWRLLSILSVPGVNKILSGNIPVMWNMRLTMRGWAGLTFQVCYKFCGWNKGASKRKKKVMKECGERTERDKNTFDNASTDTLGNLNILYSVCGSN